MSDTAPQNQNVLLAGHVAPVPTPRRRGEEVWRVVRDGHTMSCELRDESRFGAGWDLAIRQDGELSFSRRCPDEASARFVANALKQDQLNAGWLGRTDVSDAGPPTHALTSPGARCVAALFIILSAGLTAEPRPPFTKIASARQLAPVGYRDPIGNISPDGIWTAWIVEQHLYVRRLQGPPTELSFNDNRKSGLAWLPDDRQVAVREALPDSGAQWFLYDVINRSRTALWSGGGPVTGRVEGVSMPGDRLVLPVGQLRELAWSPDGRFVAGVVSSGRGTQFWTIDAAGTSARVRLSNQSLTALAWLPDSSKVVCVMTTDNGPRISLPCGDAPGPAWTQDVYGSIAVSPDGRSLYFASPNDQGVLELWRRDLAQRRSERIAGFQRDTYAPSTDRNGRVLFKRQTFSSSIGVVASAGGRSRAITTFQSETPVWHPTGTSIGLTYGNWRRVVDDQRYPDIAQDLGLVDLTRPLPAKAVSAIVEASPSEDQGMTWSPNGKWIAFHSHQQQSDDIWIRPAEGSAAPRRISSGGYETGWPRWSPDGRWIAYATEQSGGAPTHGQLFIIAVNQETGASEAAHELPLTGVTGDVEHAEWMPDSGHLVVSTAGPGVAERAIYQVSRMGGPARRVHTFASEQLLSGIGLSPDGRVVAFVAPDAAGWFQIFTVALNGGAARQVTVDRIDKTQPAWSPDGTHIAFTRFEYRVDFLLLLPPGFDPSRPGAKRTNRPAAAARW